MRCIIFHIARAVALSVALSVIEKITVTKYYECSLNIDEQNNDVINSRAKKRWYLAYTLVRNPDLIELRRRDHQDDSSKKDPMKDTGHFNPAYVNDDGEFGVPLEKDDATKL